VTGLLEREEQLRAAAALVGGAVSGAGGVLVVEGEAGIGKTAYVEAVVEEARRAGCRHLGAVAGELEQAFPYGVLRGLLAPVLRGVGQAGGDEELLRGAPRLVVQAIEGDVVGRDDAPGVLGAVAYGFYWVCSNVSEGAPLLLSVDDAHWADDASLRVLSYLARRLGDLPVLLVISKRPGPRCNVGLVEEMLAAVPHTPVRLGPLGESSVATLVRRRLGVPPENVFVRACVEATRGNPFLLVEALGALARERVAPTSQEAARVRDALPETVARAVAHRLRRLGVPAARIAHAIAVLGPDADLGAAAELAGVGVEAATDACDALVAEDILALGWPLHFQHPLVRSAVYADCAVAGRALLHRRAAQLLHHRGVGADELARHLLVCLPAGDPWVVDRLRAAAALATSRGVPEAAVSFLQRARIEPAAAAQAPAVLVELGLAMARSAPSPAAVAMLTEAMVATPDEETLVRVSIELAPMLMFLGRGDEARAVLNQARAVVSDPRSPLGLRFEAMAGYAALAGIEPIDAWCRSVHDVVASLSGTGVEERLLLSVAAFVAAATGARTAGDVLTLALRSGDGSGPDDPPVTRHMAGAALSIADRPDAAADVLGLGVACAQGSGDVPGYALLSIMQSRNSFCAGRLVDAEAEARGALALSDSRPELRHMAAGVLIETLVERDELAEARRLCDTPELLGEVPMTVLSSHFLYLGRARLRMADSQPGEALKDLMRCGHALELGGYTNPGFAPWRPEAALALHALDRDEEARAMADREIELATAFGAPRARGMALRARALVGARDERVELLTRAVEVLEASPARLELARAVVDLGAAIRRSNRSHEARTVLVRGLDLADRCGGVALARRAREELVAAGGRPRRRRLTGPEALTAGERRVARLAAEGGTNRDIAQGLFLSIRTVEIHLTNTYRKLGISSRAELAAALTGRVAWPPTGGSANVLGAVHDAGGGTAA
jgi:DNA-binding CsgD family transcriptional regulator